MKKGEDDRAITVDRVPGYLLLRFSVDCQVPWWPPDGETDTSLRYNGIYNLERWKSANGPLWPLFLKWYRTRRKTSYVNCPYCLRPLETTGSTEEPKGTV